MESRSAPKETSLVETFISVTSATPEEARFFLESHNWLLDSAVHSFYDTSPSSPFDPHPAQPRTGEDGAEGDNDDDEDYVPENDVPPPVAVPVVRSTGSRGEKSGDFEEVLSDSSEKECDEIDNIDDGKDATEDCEDRAEEPKVGMEFDTSKEAYLYYSRYANGFAVAKRTSRKGKDRNLKHVIIQCSRGGKARVRTSNPVKPRPQTKLNCPARLCVGVHPDGKWRLTQVALDHNHEKSPGKSRFYKSNRVLDEHVKRKLELNDKAGIQMHKSYASLAIEAGGPAKLPYLEKDC